MKSIILLNMYTDLPASLWGGKVPVKAVHRQIWLARPGDVLVTPVPLHPSIIQYASDVLRRDLSTVHVITDEGILKDSSLSNENLISKLTAAISGRPDQWCLNYSYLTPGVARLAERLGLGFEAGDFARQDGNELVNRKANFRRLAAVSKLPIPLGAVTRSVSDALDAAGAIGRVSTKLMLKSDHGAGGYGNVVIGDVSLPSACQGALRTVHYRDQQELETAVRDTWNLLGGADGLPVIIEQYHDDGFPFYLEYRITDGGEVSFLTSGDILNSLAPGANQYTWRGLEIPSVLPDSVVQRARLNAERFLSFLGRLGYRGFINIDGVFLADGRVLFNEVNGRWGGGTVIYSLAAGVAGGGSNDIEKRSSFRLLRDMPTLDSNVLEGLSQTLCIDGAALYLMTCDPEGSGGSEILLAGNSTYELDRLESKLMSHLDRANLLSR